MGLKSQLQYLNFNRFFLYRLVRKGNSGFKISGFSGFYCDFLKAMHSVAEYTAGIKFLL